MNSEVSTDRPNIVLIMTDDMTRQQFGFLGGGSYTPNLDTLAKDGVHFRRAHVASALCAPSRFSLLTGKDPSRAPNVPKGSDGQQYWRQGARYLPGQSNTIAQELQSSGYQTGLVGKVHAMKAEGDSYSEQVESLKRHGFDYVSSIYTGNDYDSHNQDWITQGALNFLEKTEQSEPFFLYMSSTLRHVPEITDEFGGSSSTTPNWDDSVLGETPAGFLGEEDENTQLSLTDVRENRERIRQTVLDQGRSLDRVGETWLDDGIGQILTKLDDLGIAENTLVIFQNDQGGEGGKGSVYEVGSNTPLLMYWKGKTETLSDSNFYAQNYDIFPTILDYAQITPDKEEIIDGVSLAPILEGEEEITDGRDYAYTAIGHTRSITQGDWKYVAFRLPTEFDEDTTPLNNPNINNLEKLTSIERFVNNTHPHYLDADQLYNIKEDINFRNPESKSYDPYEENNLVNNGVHRPRLNRLKSLLAQHLVTLPGSFGEFKYEVNPLRKRRIKGDLDLSANYNAIAFNLDAELGEPEYTVIKYTGNLIGTFEFDQSITDRGYQIDYSTPGEIKLISEKEPLVADIHDVLTGDGEANIFEGLEGNDEIRGKGGDDHLFGNEGSDRLFGDEGNDQIVGGDGNDTIVGGGGLDTLTGGEGRDDFKFKSINGKADIITDFHSGEDRIIIDVPIDDFNLSTGRLPKQEFVIGTHAQDQNDRFIFNINNNVLFFDPDGNGSQSASKIAILRDLPNLLASDIRII